MDYATFSALADRVTALYKGVKRKGQPGYEQVWPYRKIQTDEPKKRRGKRSAEPAPERTMADRRYAVIVVNERTGKTTVMTRPDEPVTHDEAVTIMGKISQRKGRRVQLHEVTGGQKVPERMTTSDEHERMRAQQARENRY